MNTLETIIVEGIYNQEGAAAAPYQAFFQMEELKKTYITKFLMNDHLYENVIINP